MESKLDGSVSNEKSDYNLYEYFTTVTLQLPQIHDKTAIIYKDTTNISYTSLHQRIIQISEFIYKSLNGNIDIENKTPIIAVHFTPDADLIPTLLAIHRLSCSYLPLDPKLPPERMEYMIQDANPICIISNESNSEKLNNVLSANNNNIPCININEISGINESLISTDILRYNSSSLAVVLYTSGSTGTPKGVCLSHRTIMNRLIWQWQQYPITEGDKGILKTSLNFVDHIGEIFAFILKGLPIVVIEPQNIINMVQFVDTIHKHQVTYLIVVPSFLRNILLFTKTVVMTNKIKSIKRWVCSGEPLTLELIDMFFDVNLKDSVLSNFYGSTEVMGDVTYVTFESKEHAYSILYDGVHVPIGVPVFNSSISLLNEDLSVVERGQIGEMYASGQCLANGYLNSLKNQNRFVEHNGVRMFKTGDFGLIYNGLLYFMGRQDTQVKIRGKRVDLNELEHHALKINGIDQFIPLVCENENNNIIIAYYKSSMNKSESEINRLIEDELKKVVFDYMIPSELIKLDEIPLLINGKVDKQLLKKLFKERSSEQVLHTSSNSTSGNSVADEVIEVIEKVTKVKPSNYGLSLNEVGVNSLNALDVFVGLDKCGFKLDFEQLLSTRTIEDVIKLCENYATSKLIDTNKSRNKYSFYQDTEWGRGLKAIPVTEYDSIDYIINLVGEMFSTKMPVHSILGHTKENVIAFVAANSEIFKNSVEPFAVFDSKRNRMIGGAILVDGSKPIVDNGDGVFPVNKMIAAAEEDILLDLLKKHKKVLYCVCTVSDADLSLQENVIVHDFIETEIVEVAIRHNYNAIITCNAMKLTTDLCVNHKGYVLERFLRSNEFEIDGKKFYPNFSDDEGFSTCVKYL